MLAVSVSARNECIFPGSTCMQMRYGCLQLLKQIKILVAPDASRSEDEGESIPHSQVPVPLPRLFGVPASSRGGC